MTTPDESPQLKATADALRRMAPEMAENPDELTRARHLRALAEQRAGAPGRTGAARSARIGAQRRMRPLLAAAAAAALVAVAAVAVVPGGAGPDTASESVGGAASSAASSPTSSPAGSIDDSDDRFAQESAEEAAARAARTPSPVPLTRTEDYVILTVSAERAEEVAAQLATTAGADPARIGISEQSTVFAVPASVAQNIEASEGITAVADTPIRTFSEPSEQSPVPSWGLDRIDAVDVPLDTAYRFISRGSGVRVYVIDTGIRADHADLSGRVTPGWSAIADDQGTNDCNGHGTHVAGTVAGSAFGVAKSAVVVPVRVLDCTGAGYTSSVIAGVNWVIANHPGGPAVINMSLGGPANSSLDRAVADAAAAGITVVAAAGNSATDACSTSPARAPQALTIGATTSTDARAPYSNYGSCVDLFAPGSGITSAWISSATASRTLSGTSMAAPHVAGMAARLLEMQPGSSPSAVATTLTGSATADVISETNGSVNLLANIVETPSEESPEETPEETPEEEPGEEPGDGDPVEETPEEVAPAPTEPRQPGNSGRGNNGGDTTRTPPGRAKKSPAPAGFTLSVADGVVVARWREDDTVAGYRLECAAGAADAARHRPDFVLEFLPEEATLLPTRERQIPLPAEAAGNSRCWLVAEAAPDGRNDTSSEPSSVEVIPWATARPVTNPGNGGNPPGLGSTPPGLGSTPPGLGSTPPGLGSTPPGLGGTPPGLSGGNPATRPAPPAPAIPAPPAQAPAGPPAQAPGGPPAAADASPRPVPGPPSAPGNWGTAPGRNR